MTEVHCLEYGCRYNYNDTCQRDKIELNPDAVCCTGEPKDKKAK
jgi:hypothetical protein